MTSTTDSKIRGFLCQARTEVNSYGSVVGLLTSSAPGGVQQRCGTVNSEIVSYISFGDLVSAWAQICSTLYMHYNLRRFDNFPHYIVAQRRLRPACASAQFDQSPRCPHEASLSPTLPTGSENIVDFSPTGTQVGGRRTSRTSFLATRLIFELCRRKPDFIIIRLESS